MYSAIHEDFFEPHTIQATCKQTLQRVSIRIPHSKLKLYANLLKCDEAAITGLHMTLPLLEPFDWSGITVFERIISGDNIESAVAVIGIALLHPSWKAIYGPDPIEMLVKYTRTGVLKALVSSKIPSIVKSFSLCLLKSYKIWGEHSNICRELKMSLWSLTLSEMCPTKVVFHISSGHLTQENFLVEPLNRLHSFINMFHIVQTKPMLRTKKDTFNEVYELFVLYSFIRHDDMPYEQRTMYTFPYIIGYTSNELMTCSDEFNRLYATLVTKIAERVLNITSPRSLIFHCFHHLLQTDNMKTTAHDTYLFACYPQLKSNMLEDFVTFISKCVETLQGHSTTNLLFENTLSQLLLLIQKGTSSIQTQHIATILNLMISSGGIKTRHKEYISQFYDLFESREMPRFKRINIVLPTVIAELIHHGTIKGLENELNSVCGYYAYNDKTVRFRSGNPIGNNNDERDQLTSEFLKEITNIITSVKKLEVMYETYSTLNVKMFQHYENLQKTKTQQLKSFQGSYIKWCKIISERSPHINFDDVNKTIFHTFVQ